MFERAGQSSKALTFGSDDVDPSLLTRRPAFVENGGLCETDIIGT